MRVIFLDIDGCLNSHSFNKTVIYDPDDRIDPDCVNRLNHIIDETKAVCVLSSDWRFTFGPNRMTNHLKKFGFTGSVIGTTKDNRDSRFNQIKDWISDADIIVDNFVIIDDINIFENVSHLPTFKKLRDKHLVLTDPNIGLSLADMHHAINLLNSK